MNRQEHAIIGLFAFLGYSLPLYLIHNTIPEGFIWGMLAVAVGSITPDILEPATSWNHRGRWHSKSTLRFFLKISTITAFVGFLSIFFKPFSIFYVLAGFPIGYLFHLLADSTTKMGLPDS
jgi:membrane-bound metal-dependent hydrolase YbcI (DUF457 family)